MSDTPDISGELVELAGERCFVAAADGPVVRDAEGGRALIEAAMNCGARVIAVPAIRLDASFFELRSGLAGEVLQKAMNYGYKFAVVGDISSYVAASDAMRDFVIESDRGRSIFFMPDLETLEVRLAALKAPPE